MSSYLRSEFYRILRNKSVYLFIGICSILLISSNVVLAVVKHFDQRFPYADTFFSLSNVFSSMPMVYLLCIVVANIIFGNEHTNHTMKNTVSYGISRSTIYFGKLIVQMVYALTAFVLIIGAHISSAYLLLEVTGQKELELLLRTVFLCLPLFLFALAATNCFLFILESVGSAIGAVCGLMIALPLMINILGLRFQTFSILGDLLPWNMINEIGFDFEKLTISLPWESNGYLYYWIIGTGQMILISCIGYALFQKKEIR